MISMLRTFADQDDRRPITLIYGSPSWEETIYRDELARLAESLTLTVVHVLEDPPGGWSGESGMIDVEVLDRNLPERAERHQFFVCGPDAMTGAVERTFQQAGVPRDHINLERFEFV